MGTRRPTAQAPWGSPRSLWASGRWEFYPGWASLARGNVDDFYQIWKRVSLRAPDIWRCIQTPPIHELHSTHPEEGPGSPCSRPVGLYPEVHLAPLSHVDTGSSTEAAREWMLPVNGSPDGPGEQVSRPCFSRWRRWRPGGGGGCEEQPEDSAAQRRRERPSSQLLESPT